MSVSNDTREAFLIVHSNQRGKIHLHSNSKNFNYLILRVLQFPMQGEVFLGFSREIGATNP
jgi:hypothetical protein